eukprot:CAMPEP_0179083996 /NCGR_PEP_ID=MMETSP0796-20121207/37960_1 /TAXON_ID=73915 /ORGANISM="Pyrodinium bahamense, Strain pbaha01" /LENGTH=205 /DNA_ID=CAMNT_0020781409 /DNA_START=62 /DNA_END=676 /DNA_ORIENTATION=-
MDAARSEAPGQAKSKSEDDEEEDKGTVVVSDMRANSTKSGQGRRPSKDQRIMGAAASSSTQAPSEEAPATPASAPTPLKDDVVKQVQDLQLREGGDRSGQAAPAASDLHVEAPSRTWGGAARQPSAEPPEPTSARLRASQGSGPGSDDAAGPPKSPHGRSLAITDALVASQGDANADEADGFSRKAKKMNTLQHSGNVESFSKLN